MTDTARRAPRSDSVPDTGVSAAVAAIAEGGMAIVVDDPGRENEGDLVMAAEHVTPAAVNFMATHGRGLICVAMSRQRLHELAIPAMVEDSTDPRGTAFHVGVDLVGQVSGISAAERAATIRALAGDAATASDFSKPGHVFPLACRPGGIAERAGHTEASVHLAQLADLGPAAVICEIAGEDGEMMRMPELERYACRHDLPIVSIAELAADTTTRQSPSVERVSSARVPLRAGTFEMVGFRDRTDGREHLAAVFGDVRGDDVLTRVHSECLTGDVFASSRCDCGQQLDRALNTIAAEGRGVVVYLRGHEGRGIGLLEKLNAYRLQDAGLDTVDANLALGHPADGRDYAVGVDILRDLGVCGVRLMTNNPSKIEALEANGMRVARPVPIISDPTPHNVEYLRTKLTRMGHTLDDDRSGIEARQQS